MRTTVAIIGAGPAGLVLGRLLHRAGIDTVILESGSDEAILGTGRAGLLEPGTMAILRAAGADATGDAVRHRGVRFACDGRLHRLDLTAGAADGGMWLHPQPRVLRGLRGAHLAEGGDIRFGACQVRIDLDASPSPAVSFTDHAGSHRLSCALVAGCDGARGTSLATLRPHLTRDDVRRAPFAWLGVLVETSPACDELVYVRHPRGFALLSTRSATVQRWYLQCGMGDTLEMWPATRIWAELQRRCGDTDGIEIVPGRLLDASIVHLRSRLVEPLQHGPLLLAGDAAHLVPPTGAKGLNLAVADAADLASVIVDAVREDRPDRLEAYTARALPRVRAAMDFSWWMTALLHTPPGRGDDARGAAALRALVTSPERIARFAAAYTGRLREPVGA